MKKIGSATEYINDLCRKENCNANEIVFNPNIITKLMGLNLINQLYITSGVITILWFLQINITELKTYLIVF